MAKVISGASDKNMGNWRSHAIAKESRGNRTRSTKSKIYYAIPPATGWPGGAPEQNGYKRNGKK